MQLELPNFDLVKLKDWSKREWALVAGAVIVLTLLAFYLGFYRPKAAAVSKLKQLNERARKALQAGNQPSASLSELQKRVEGLEKKLGKAVERMSGNVQLVQVLKQLGTHLGVKKISVEDIDVREVQKAPLQSTQKPLDTADGKNKQKKSKAAMDIRIQEVEMTLYGSYESIAQYLEALKELPALLVVEKLELKRDATVFPNLKVLLILRFHSVERLPKELLKS